MRKWSIIIIVWVLILILANSFDIPPVNPVNQYQKYLSNELTFSIENLNNIKNDITNKPQGIKYFKKARYHYKHVETFVEYYTPIPAKFFINGPLVPKHDPEYGKTVFYPNGFQAIEEALYTDEVSLSTLDTLITNLISSLEGLKKYYSSMDVEQELLLEAAQYEVIRIASLNISGYDATISLTGIEETCWSLEGIESLVACFKSYTDNDNDALKNYNDINASIQRAKKYLKKSNDYFSLNRLEFITKYLIPINASLVNFHNSVNLPWSTRRKVIRLNNANPFIEKSFDIRFFALFHGDTTNLNQKRELGKKLFFDPILSGNKKRSCSTCHVPELAFTDGFPKSLHINEQQQVERNAPTLMNVGFQQNFFYDGRVNQLEQQAFEVIHNKKEMDGDLNKVVFELRNHNEYQKLFKEAFAGSYDTVITTFAIQIAIAEYERSLVSLNSRFDKYLQGDLNALTPREINGYNLFSGKALCGSCHFFPLFNGTVPPFYHDSEFEVLGTPDNNNPNMLDSDLGRYSITKIPEQKFGFKTPTVRNIELTAPYMHNGIYQSLEEVIDFYHKGGGVGLGLEVPNQTLPFDSLSLNQQEKEDLVLFLKSLTDIAIIKK